MTYEEAAPRLSNFISEAEFKLDLPEPPEPSSGPPEPNNAKKLALYEEYVLRYNTNAGSVALSQLARVIVDQEVRAAIAAVYGE